jgi:hypothetical protein
MQELPNSQMAHCKYFKIPSKDTENTSNTCFRLATWENYSPEQNEKVYFPIWRSTNNGYTWTEISRVKDTAQGWGLRYQPFLYILCIWRLSRWNRPARWLQHPN